MSTISHIVDLDDPTRLYIHKTNPATFIQQHTKEKVLAVTYWYGMYVVVVVVSKYVVVVVVAVL